MNGSLTVSRIMKLTSFAENDSVLLLGEGKFSFAVALSKLNLNIKITATCYESSIDQETGKKNIEYLVNNGVRVLLGIDATNLGKSVLATELFDKIIFNFPHVGGKMRIERNRELLRLFFISANKTLKNDGQILVTLCNGQGGTHMDNPQRRWDDSWKITEMAAHGNFIVFKVEPFVWPSFKTYNVTGYRSLDKSFHSAGALVHVFKKSPCPNSENIAPKIKASVYKNDEVTWKDLNKQRLAMLNLDVEDSYSHVQMCDITLCTDKHFCDTKLYIVLYNNAGHIIKNVNLIDTYTVLPEGKEKRTYRISYQSDLLPLYRKRVIYIHQDLITDIIEKNLNVNVTR